MKKKLSTKNSNFTQTFSSILVDGRDRALNHAMLYHVGFKPEDFSKPIIGTRYLP